MQTNPSKLIPLGKLKRLLFIALLVVFACEDKEEPLPLDCEGVEGGTAMLDCFGVCDGMVGVTAANGTPPYTYAWNNPSIDTDFFADSLCGGMVTVLVLDNNGCPKSDSILVNEPSQLAANVSGTDLTCGSASDGTVESNASGGTPQYTYAWDNINTSSSIKNPISENFSNKILMLVFLVLATPPFFFLK